jgi:hypothetical protein
MAKKKPPAPGPASKPNGLVIRSSAEWRDTLKRAAKHDGRAMAEFIDRAVRMYAKTTGFVEEWPDR